MEGRSDEAELKGRYLGRDRRRDIEIVRSSSQTLVAHPNGLSYDIPHTSDLRITLYGNPADSH